MFFGLELGGLQVYWWVILSLLGGLLVFMFFVQGGQTLIDELSDNELEKTMLINSLGRKWELGFTTLVLFGGAAFAAFPLFYSTSFGGAYWAWLAILFCFIIQAVSYEYRKKEGNPYGARTFEIFLKINGFVGVFLIGIAVSSFFSGSHFVLDSQNFVAWQSAWRGLELLTNPFNYLLAFALVFLSRILALAYFRNNIADSAIHSKIARKSLLNSALFLVFFVAFLVWVCLKDGFVLDSSGVVAIQSNAYFWAFINSPLILSILLLGVVLALLGIYLLVFTKCACAIWSLGLGSVLAVFAVFLSLGLGGGVFYPSLSDLQSSLSIKNASSSYYTLSVMSYVSLLVPFVLAYISFVWRAMDKVKITQDEMRNDSHTY